jgi:Rad3-related DNA helicase
MTRHLVQHATILVYNYQYMLDPKVANLVSRELEAESIVVFDEAHNIDNVCIEALSVTLDRKSIDLSVRSVGKLQRKVEEIKASDSAKLGAFYPPTPFNSTLIASISRSLFSLLLFQCQRENTRNWSRDWPNSTAPQVNTALDRPEGQG